MLGSWKVVPNNWVTYDDWRIFTYRQRKVGYKPVRRHYFFFDRPLVLLLLVGDWVSLFCDFLRNGGWHLFFHVLAALLLPSAKFPDALVGDLFFDEAPSDRWAPPRFFYLECCDLFLLACLFSELSSCCFFSAAASLNFALTFFSSVSSRLQFQQLSSLAFLGRKTLSLELRQWSSFCP